MSIITATIIFTAFVIYFGIQLAKNLQLRSLNTCLRKRDYESVEKLCTMPMVRKLLGEYTADLYQLRGYYTDKNIGKFEQQLKKMLQASYPNPEDKKSFLEQYYHTFLIKENRKYADWMLDGIRALEDPLYTKFNEQAYSVMLDKRSDLIEEMIEEINSKKYYGFSLGVILFMIAKQFEYREDGENAAIYYENARVCFHPSVIYVPIIKKKLEQLAPERETAPV